MGPRLRKITKSKRTYPLSESDDSDSDDVFDKKLGAEMFRRTHKKVKKLSDSSSFLNEDSSYNDQNIKKAENNNKRNTNTIKRDNNISSKHKVNHEEYSVCIPDEYDGDAIKQIFELSGIKLVNDKKNTVEISNIVESSSSSSSSIIQRKKRVLNISNNKEENNKVEESRKHSQRVGSCSNNTDGDLNSVIIDTSAKHSREENKKKQELDENFKSYIIKSVEDLQHKFFKYKLQINHLVSKYFKEDTLMLKDVENIAFLFSCIICKLKEELTEQEQDLINYYFQLSKDYKSNSTASNTQYRQCANNKKLQVQSEKHIEYSSDDELFSPRNSKKRSYEVTKSSKDDVQRSNDTVPQGNIRNHTNKRPMRTEDVPMNSTRRDDSDVVPQYNRSLSPILSILKEDQLMKLQVEDSAMNKENAEIDIFSENVLEKSFNTEEESVHNKSGSKMQIIDVDSDVSSTCSTVLLTVCSLENKGQYVDECRNGLTNTRKIIRADESESLASKNTLISDEVPESRLYYSDSSDETIVIPCTKSKQHLRNKSNDDSQITLKLPTVLSNNGNTNYQQNSNCVVPKAHTVRPRYRFKPNLGIYRENFNANTNLKIKTEGNIVDKKLQMDCKVLLDKYMY